MGVYPTIRGVLFNQDLNYREMEIGKTYKLKANKAFLNLGNHNSVKVIEKGRGDNYKVITDKGYECFLSKDFVELDS